MPEAGRGRWVKPEARTLLGSRPESPRYAPVARADEDPLRATSAPAKASWLSWKLSLPLACLLAAVALLAAGYRFPTFAPAHHDTSESAREFSAPRAAHAHSPEAPSRREEEALLRALVLKHHHATRPSVDGASATTPADASRDATSKGDIALTLDEKASRAKTKSNADGAADPEASSEPSKTTAETGKAEKSAAKETGRRRDDVAETGESKTNRRAASKRSSETRSSRHANVEDAKRHGRGRGGGGGGARPRDRRPSETRDDRPSAAKVGDTKRHHHEHPHERHEHHHHERHEHHHHHHAAKATWSVDENGVLVMRPATFAALGDASSATDALATAAAAARGEATGREVGEAMVADIAAAADRALDDGGSSRRRREDARRETTDARRRVASVAVDPAGEAVRRRGADRTAEKAKNENENENENVAAGTILADLEDDELARRVAALSSLDDE